MRDAVALPLIGLVSAAVVVTVAILLLGSAPAAAVAGSVAALPAINAALNATSALLLVVGYVFVRGRSIAAHRAAMLSAFATSVLFLVSYVTYHALAGSRPFPGQGVIRWVYFPLLITHVVLAAAIVPLALAVLYRAWQGDFARHRRIARWTLPIWLYVSITGVLVYWMLYRLAPA